MLILLVIVAITWVSRKTVKEISYFKHWLAGLKDNKQANIDVPDNLHFLEMQQAAKTLASSLNVERELQQQKSEWITREKAFLSTLSHELRNPIAIINAATTLLTRRATLEEKDAKTLAKLTKANDSLKELTNTLLQIWRKQEAKNSRQAIKLATAVEAAIEICKQSMATKTIIVLDKDQNREMNSCINASPELLNILLLNVLRNACQYSADQKVIISLHNQGLTITNTVETQTTTASPQEKQANMYHDNNEVVPRYGYGLGLYLVETICQHQNWQLQIDDSDKRFTISITFTGNQ